MSASTPLESFSVGKATVTRIPELTIEQAAPAWLYPDVDAEQVAEVRPRLDRVDMDAGQENFVISIHSWLVEVDGRSVLIDTATGNGKHRPHFPVFHELDNPYLERLAAAGVAPDELDAVLITHVHADHVGWNTRLVDGRWTPTFANAAYHLPEVDDEYYASLASHNQANIPSLGAWEDSIWPVKQAGQAQTVGAEGGTVLDRFTYLPTPGHSKGHMSIRLDGGDGHVGLFWGDVAHNPAQVLRPTWQSVFCEFGEQAEASRRQALELAADEQALVFATHFPGPSAGRVAREGDGHTWSYAR